MITFAHDCPHCGTENTAFEVHACYKSLQLQGTSSAVYRISLMAVCNKCKNAIVTSQSLGEHKALTLGRAHTSKEWIDLGSIYTMLNIQPFAFLPKPPDLAIPKYLPNEVLQQMRTAEKLYLKVKGDDDMIEPSGNAYRKALEIALANLDNGTDKNLSQRINKLTSQGLLVKSMSDFAHRIRVLGNAATHDVLELEELEELRTFIQLFLQYTFTLPAMIPAKS